MAPAEPPWIQVIGSIAVHGTTGEPRPLAGSTKTLLATLVAAGTDGTLIEDLAEIYWKTNRPRSWQIALRSAIAHLQVQLTPGWRISNDGGVVRLVCESGWVDAWRVEQHGAFEERPDWVVDGPPFAGIGGIGAIDRARERLTALLPVCVATAHSTLSPSVRLRDASSAVLIGDPDRRAETLRESRLADQVDTVVVGDRDLQVPLGPFSIAFPSVRNQIDAARGLIEHGAALKAWHIVSSDLSSRATSAPQRLIIDGADQLDRPSLALTGFLVERRRSSDFSMIICVDKDARSLRWLDLRDRAQTAGARVIELN